jgi:hypothetical protein
MAVVTHAAMAFLVDASWEEDKVRLLPDGAPFRGELRMVRLLSSF